MVAAMGITLTTRDFLPQFADLDRLPDIPAYLVAIEEVGSMNVIAPAVITPPLFHCIDVPNEVLEDQMAAVFSNQSIQVSEDLLDSQPGLRLSTVVEVQPDDRSTCCR